MILKVGNGEKEKIRPLSDAEYDIWMCRLQGAVFEEDFERIEKIQIEIKERIKELKKAGLWHGKD